MLPSSASKPQPSNRSQTRPERFLVCGLGSVGQHCVAVLKEYGVAVSAIDQVQPNTWEIPDLANLDDSDRQSKIFAALAEPTRSQIVDLLANCIKTY